MGPRPFGRGNALRVLHSTSDMGLQWGRDLSVAEMRSSIFRNQSGRFPLQWGRDLSVAEMMGSVFSCMLSFRFNGAATFRSRK